MAYETIEARVTRLKALRDRPKIVRRLVVYKSPPFARFAKNTIATIKHRVLKTGIPFTIETDDVERILAEQNWKCAVSGIQFEEPRKERHPFAPSIDRIRPALGYVPGNIRAVCLIVNYAMHGWGERALIELIARWNTEGTKDMLRRAERRYRTATPID